MNERPVQYFNADYLERCKELSTEQIVEFIQQYQTLLNSQDQKTKPISIRIPNNLLEAFKTRARLEGRSYQARIIELMREDLCKNGK